MAIEAGQSEVEIYFRRKSCNTVIFVRFEPESFDSILRAVGMGGLEMHEVVQDSSRRALHLPVTVTNTGGLAVAQVGGGKLVIST